MEILVRNLPSVFPWVPKMSEQRGYIQWRNGVARILVREPILRPDGSIKRQLVQYPLGRVSPEEAEQMRLQIVARLATQAAPTNHITVRDFIEQRFLPERVSNLALGTRKVYTSILRQHIIAAYGDRQLRHLSVTDLQRLCNMKRDAGYPLETLKHIKAYSSAFLQYARELRLIDSNPARAVRLPRSHEKRERPTPEEAEAGKLLVVLRDPTYSPCYEMVLLSCCTSVHYAEMAGLRWRRVNLSSKPMVADGKNLPPYSLAIREDYYRGEFGPPKNAGRNRIERMPMDVVTALVAHHARSEFTGPDDLVFCNEEGKPLDEHKMRRKLTAACKAAGILHLGWHAFRRYFATQSDRKGMHPLDRQHSLGHASQEMTARYTTADLERRTPHVERICRGLLDAAATSETPAKAS